MDSFPLSYLKDFKPFSLDALGLVTLLGAREVDNGVGRLVRSRYFEYMPFLGAYIFASDAFTLKQVGFQLYNFTAGMVTTDLAGWFTRWLMAQDFQLAGSYVELTVESEPKSFTKDRMIAWTISILINGGIMAFAFLISDWWGFANAVSMTLSVLVKAYLLHCNRIWLDETARSSVKLASDDSDVKVLVVLADSRAVLLRCDGRLVKPCLTANPTPTPGQQGLKKTATWPTKQREQDRKPIEARKMDVHKYEGAKFFAWIAFGAHVVTIGMSTLAVQLVTVVVIVFSTFFVLQGIGCDDSIITPHLHMRIGDFPPEEEGPGRRVDLYAFMNLSQKEKEELKAWDLAPHQSNTSWWTDFERKENLYNEPKPLADLDTWARRQGELKRRCEERCAPTPPDRATTQKSMSSTNRHVLPGDP